VRHNAALNKSVLVHATNKGNTAARTRQRQHLPPAKSPAVPFSNSNT